MDEGARRYAAFLSYSHKDAAAARRLHRRLETYRIPRRLVGSEGQRGPVPPRLTPIFRDREELPAAGDLSEAVRAALAASDALIILCSPAAAESSWVAKEIDAFRALHPDRPVIAAILEGEPTEAFPPNLAAAGAEPLAADLRQGRDGRRLGLLKLVAGLSGLPLDALVQRDAQRKLRRVTAVTGVALAAVVAMAVLTAVALQARAEAQRQRAEAEGLVEFMLTDLRDRLKGVGRLDVLTVAARRALDHYRDDNLRKLPTNALLRRARILQALGEDEITVGHLSEALAEFVEANRTTSEELARNPSDPERIFAQGQSEYWIGRVHELRREWPHARRRYERYAAAAKRLIMIAPNRPEYMMEMGWGAQNLGAIELDGEQRARSAERRFGEAVEWFTKASSFPRFHVSAERELANALGWLSGSYDQEHRWSDSLQAHLRQIDAIKRLRANDPSDAQLVYRLAISERSVARLAEQTGTAVYRPLMASSLVHARWLTMRDPKNTEWLLFRAKIECDLLRMPQFTHSSRNVRELVDDIRHIRSRLGKNPAIVELAQCYA